MVAYLVQKCNDVTCICNHMLWWFNHIIYVFNHITYIPYHMYIQSYNVRHSSISTIYIQSVLICSLVTECKWCRWQFCTICRGAARACRVVRRARVILARLWLLGVEVFSPIENLSPRETLKMALFWHAWLPIKSLIVKSISV